MGGWGQGNGRLEEKGVGNVHEAGKEVVGSGIPKPWGGGGVHRYISDR